MTTVIIPKQKYKILDKPFSKAKLRKIISNDEKITGYLEMSFEDYNEDSFDCVKLGIFGENSEDYDFNGMLEPVAISGDNLIVFFQGNIFDLT
jgi:hypothetical protein